MKYYIEKYEPLNSNGFKNATEYYVKYRKTFLFFWTRWYYVCYPSLHGPMRYRAQSEKQATDLINNVLCKGLWPGKGSYKLIGSIKCGK